MWYILDNSQIKCREQQVEEFMEKFDLYQDIATRTNGDIYIGVVGPVRVGKSSFITKFMQTIVLPSIDDMPRKQRILDELPQSADGKTIMTTQPKFVPDGGVKAKLGEGLNPNIRLVDCVGYPVRDAKGFDEGEKTRLVTTPWTEEEIPFEQAAEIGTRKVIQDHSTIGVVVTTDGSITGIKRENYVDSEERVVREMQELGKPFVVLLNSKTPHDSKSKQLRQNLEEKYGCSVLLYNILDMSAGDMADVLKEILGEFPLQMLDVELPSWLQALPRDNGIIGHILDNVTSSMDNITKMKDYVKLYDLFQDDEYLDKSGEVSVEFGKGKCTLVVKPKPHLFYEVLSEQSGQEIKDDFALISYIKELASAKSQFDRIKSALEDVDNFGYGIVVPGVEELELMPPQIVKKGGKYSVKLHAKSSSLHIMKIDVDTEVNSLIGSEASSQEILESWLQDFGEDGMGLWKTNMLGKSLDNIAKEGISNKLMTMPEDARSKMQKAVSKIVNDGKGGVVCILL